MTAAGSWGTLGYPKPYLVRVYVFHDSGLHTLLGGENGHTMQTTFIFLGACIGAIFPGLPVGTPSIHTITTPMLVTTPTDVMS